jgi:sugar phosphate isomerase/epimerase
MAPDRSLGALLHCCDRSLYARDDADRRSARALLAKEVRRDSRTADSRTIEAPPPMGIAVAVTEGGADNPHGTETGWDRLTSHDIERIRRALAARRADALARHAEELKKLDAEQAEIDAIEMAINSFAAKYKA